MIFWWYRITDRNAVRYFENDLKWIQKNKFLCHEKGAIIEYHLIYHRKLIDTIFTTSTSVQKFKFVSISSRQKPFFSPISLQFLTFIFFYSKWCFVSYFFQQRSQAYLVSSVTMYVHSIFYSTIDSTTTVTSATTMSIPTTPYNELVKFYSNFQLLLTCLNSPKIQQLLSYPNILICLDLKNISHSTWDKFNKVKQIWQLLILIELKKCVQQKIIHIYFEHLHNICKNNNKY